MLIKTFIFFILFINFEIPLNSIFDLFLTGIVITLLFSIKRNLTINDILVKKKIIFLILTLSIFNFLLPKLNIEEAHSVFLNYKDIEKISEILPNNIIQNIKSDYKNFDFERLSKKHNLSEDDFLNTKYIDKPYAFSLDSFLQNQRFTRIINKINFKSREDLRIGQINSLNFNFAHDKEFRRILPYYVMFEIPEIAQGSEICSKGNFFYYHAKSKIDKKNIKNLDFKKITDNCIAFKSSFKKLYIIGYSINKDDNLSANLKKNFLTNLIYSINLIVKLILILIIFRYLFKIKFTDRTYIYLISFISTILICFLKDANLITGLRYFRGGADGLLYYSYGRDIIENLSYGNLLLALRGGADVFYFMPGQRYFVAITSIFFGESSYGYVLLASLLPIIIYIFFKKFINKKYAQILFTLFIFLPIFENLGFGYFNYIHQITRNHSETLSILLILISFIYLLNISDLKKNDQNKLTTISIGLILAFTAILRPNFFLTTSVIIIFMIIIFYKKKDYFNILLLSLGYSFFLSCLLHNVYFGNELNLFSNAFNSKNFPINISIIKLAFKELVYLNFNGNNLNKIINQFFWWNPIYNIHRLLIIIFIFYCFKKYKQSFFNISLFLCMILQHTFLFISDASSRYAYLAWLLTFILFIRLIYQQKYFPKIKKLINFN